MDSEVRRCFDDAARADSAPARCPAERGNPRDVAQRPLPSEMMATCKPGSRVKEVFVVIMSCVVRCCMLFTSFSAAGKSYYKLLCSVK